MSGSLGQTTPQTIIFNEIPASRRDPGVLVEVRPNYGAAGLQLLPSKAVVISQMLASGSAQPNTLYPITGPGQAEALFGAGSVAATQVNAWLANNTTTALYAIGVPDAAGSVAASTNVILSPAQFPNGFSVTALVAGFAVPVVIPAGTAQTDLALALVAAINAMPTLPASAALMAGNVSNVTLTAKNAGVVGNDINLRFINRSDASAPVVVIAPSAAGQGPANLAGGLGSPSVAAAIAAISGNWFTDCVTPWTDPVNRPLLAAEGMRRYGALVNLDMRIYSAINGSYATVAAYGDAGNSIQMVTWGVRNEVDPTWSVAAAFGAVHAFRLANDPSRQSKGIAVAGLTAPSSVDQWTAQERDLLLHNGISTWTALPDHTMVISRTITGYLTSPLGVADAAWLDVMTPATMTAIRYDWTDYVKLVYPQAKLFNDDALGAEYDESAATPRRMRGSWAKRCLDYEQAGWIEGSASTVQQGYFVINASDKNRLDQQVVVSVAGNLIVEATVLEFTA